MTPEQALETLEGVEHHGSLGEAADVLTAVVLSAWATRVLDERALQLGIQRVLAPYVEYVFTPATGRSRRLGWWHDWMDDGAKCVDSPGAARLAAAETVYPLLKEDVRTRLGPKPKVTLGVKL